MYSYGPPHMAEQNQDDQLEHTYSSYVSIQDVALKTCQRRWTIGRSGERGSEISVLAVRHDDDDDDDDDITNYSMLLVHIQTYSYTGQQWQVFHFQQHHTRRKQNQNERRTVKKNVYTEAFKSLHTYTYKERKTCHTILGLVDLPLI